MLSHLLYWRNLWNYGTVKIEQGRAYRSHTAKEIEAFNQRLSKLSDKKFVRYQHGTGSAATISAVGSKGWTLIR